MKKSILFCFCFFSLSFFSWAFSPVDYVNPLMGTASTFEFSHGNTYPAVAVPWGMNFWSPQTGRNGSGWMYAYDDKEIRGFRQTHQPSPWINDYGTFSLMPVSGDLRLVDSERGVSFSHENETAKPYYYAVKMDDGTSVGLTATNRGAVFKVKFARGKKQFVVLDAYNKGCSVSIDSLEGRMTGYVKNNNGGVPSNFANYFIVEFDRPVKSYGTCTNGVLAEGKAYAEHFAVCGYAEFDLQDGDSLTIRVASSFIGHEQAELNFGREVANRSFESVMEESKKEWNDKMGRIRVEGECAQGDLQTFYSCLYRTLLFPREFFEYNIQNQPVYYSPYDGKVHHGYMYTDNGFWDTFRAVHPLFTLVYPEVSGRVVQSLLNAYDESGFLPEWASPGHRGCMIGNNSISLLADAWRKGIRDFDQEKAKRAMVHQTMAQGCEASVGRNGFDEYHRLGYVPYPDYPEATAKTLEYAYADWCLSQFANAVGDTVLWREYERKSQNYRNLFDKQSGFMRAKNKVGKWIEPFDAVEWGGPFTEGCSWHYTWSVFHDIEGLSRLMGGHSAMAQKLDSMFSAPNKYNYGTYGFVIHEIAEMVALDMGQYAHGNQPVQHAVYLYNYVEQPWRTQRRVREVMCRLYKPTPDGYCGDEDNGQTSAWYVFSAMGFYPVCPGVPEYVIGSPLFKKVTLAFPNGRSFVIDASKNASQNVFVKAAKLNGKSFEDNYLSHGTLVDGGVLRLDMSERPNLKRSIKPNNAPYSFSGKR